MPYLYDAKTEVLYHRGKVPVVMQKFMVVLDAEGSNYDVNSLPDCYPAPPQKAVVPCGLDCEYVIEHRDHFELPHVTLDAA